MSSEFESPSHCPREATTVMVVRHPNGQVQPEDLSIRSAPLAHEVGNVVTRTAAISLDPYLALRLSDAAANGDPLPAAMRSRTVGEVIDPGNSGLDRGDHVLGFGTWSEFDTRPARELTRIDVSRVQPSAYLGALGHSGVTAWLGLMVGDLQPGETLLVSGAAGVVGGVAGQLARRRGCRVIGIAGGPQKAAWVRHGLHFDACVDHRAGNLADALRKVAPEGVDMVFENVGASTLDPGLSVIKHGGRVVLCGLRQHYQSHEPVSLDNFMLVLRKCIRILPFSIYDNLDKTGHATADLLDAAEAGELVVDQTVSYGLDAVPEAFVAMLNGTGRGKHVAILDRV